MFVSVGVCVWVLYVCHVSLFSDLRLVLSPTSSHHATPTQDLLLWEGHHLLGKRWVEISSRFFKGARSENHIKNRWYSASFKKFITKELGPDAYRLGNEGCAGRKAAVRTPPPLATTEMI